MARTKSATLTIPPEKSCPVCGTTYALWEGGRPLPVELLPFGVVQRAHYYKKLADGTLKAYPGGPQLRSRCNDCHRDAERGRAQRKRERASREPAQEAA